MYILNAPQELQVSGGDPFGTREVGYAIGLAVGTGMRALACWSGGGRAVPTGADLEAQVAAGQAADSSGLF